MNLLKYIITISLVSSALSVQAQTNNFQSGVAAFRREDFSAALDYFLAAKKQGTNSPQLTYNLGSTYFKLAHYQQSEAQFHQLISAAKWRGLALYNLGLIAEKSNNTDLAKHYYIQALQSGNNATVEKLATTRLNRMIDADAEQKASFSISAFAGRDDNAIAFADELQASSSAVSDSFFDVYGTGELSLNSSNKADNSLQGFFYKRSYQEFDSLNTDVLGISFFQDMHNSSVDRGIYLMSSLVDGEIAYHELQFHISARPLLLFNGRWTTAYELNYFAGGSDYEQLDGWQHRASAARYWRRDASVFGLTLLGEVNQRDDLSLGDSKYSYSPTRIGIDLLWRWYASAQFTYSVRGVFAHSQYAGNNRFEDLDGVVKDEKRSGNKLRVSAELNYLLGRDWTVIGKLEHTNNDENFKYYSYDRNQVVVGVNYRF